MRLSYSSISEYKNCPLKYKFHYVDRMPTKKTPALSFGSSLHEVLAYLYNVKTPDPPPIDEVYKVLDKEWLSDGYSSEAEEKQYYEHGKHVLANYYEKNIGQDFKLPLALERKFGLDMGGFTLTGIIDRLDKVAEDRYEVIDYKTSRKLPPQSYIDKDLQLSIYHMATEKIWNLTPEKVSLYFLRPNLKMSSSRTEKQIKETVDIVSNVADKVSKELFEPTQNNLCPWCDFQKYCPYFSHKFSKDKGEIVALVEEYGKLREQEKELKKKAKSVARDISVWLKDKDEKRLFSDNFEVLKSSRKTVSYDSDKIEEILKPLGLWQKITSLDNKKLSELLENGSLEDEIKEKLSGLTFTKKAYALTCKKTHK